METVKPKKVEMSADALELDLMYLWRMPCGEIKAVWLSDCGNFLDEFDDGGWEIEGLAGELFGPIDLPEHVASTH